jgi:O-antigen ligase
LLFYSFRDWFKCLCALIAMTAVSEHPDMPRSLFHIPGLNVWNALLLAVCAGWVSSRRRERLVFDGPRLFVVLGAVYAGIVLTATLRLLADPAQLGGTVGELASEYLFNTVKFVIPALLLFDGCRNRERFTFAVVAILGFYFLIGVQIIKWVPPWYALEGAELERRSREILRKEMGFYRTDLSMMMAGATWAFLSVRPLFAAPAIRVSFFVASMLSTLAMALTGGRAGYLTWAVVGVVIAALRFRKALLLVPLVVLVTAWALPGVMGRLGEGVSSGDNFVEEPIDKNEVSAGRTAVWPYIIESIGEAPWIGYGRQAMRRIGLTEKAARLEDVLEAVPHPHNSFLELLLDSGYLGFLPVMAFFVALLVVSLRLLLDTRSPIFVAAGGLATSLVLAFLVSGFGGRHFYPDPDTFGMWCAVGLVLRTWVERNRSLRPPQFAAGRTRSQVEPTPLRGPSRTPGPLPAGGS